MLSRGRGGIPRLSHRRRFRGLEAHRSARSSRAPRFRRHRAAVPQAAILRRGDPGRDGRSMRHLADRHLGILSGILTATVVVLPRSGGASESPPRADGTRPYCQTAACGVASWKRATTYLAGGSFFFRMWWAAASHEEAGAPGPPEFVGKSSRAYSS